MIFIILYLLIFDITVLLLEILNNNIGFFFKHYINTIFSFKYEQEGQDL